MAKKHQFNQSDVRIESQDTVFQGFFQSESPHPQSPPVSAAVGADH